VVHVLMLSAAQYLAQLQALPRRPAQHQLRMCTHSGLDWEARIEVVELLQRLKEECTLLVVGVMKSAFVLVFMLTHCDRLVLPSMPAPAC